MYGLNEYDISINEPEDFLKWAKKVAHFPNALASFRLHECDDDFLKNQKWHLIAPMWWKNPLLREEMLSIDNQLSNEDRQLVPVLINTVHAEELIQMMLDKKYLLTPDEYQCLPEHLQTYWMSQLSVFGEKSRLVSVLYEPSHIHYLTKEDYEFLNESAWQRQSSTVNYQINREKENLLWGYALLHPTSVGDARLLRYALPVDMLEPYGITNENLKKWFESGTHREHGSPATSCEDYILQLHTFDDKMWQIALLELDDNCYLDIDAMLYVLKEKLAHNPSFYTHFNARVEALSEKGEDIRMLDIILAYHNIVMSRDEYLEQMEKERECLSDIIDLSHCSMYEFLVKKLCDQASENDMEIHFP